MSLIDQQVASVSTAIANAPVGSIDLSTVGALRWVRAACLVQDNANAANITTVEIAGLFLCGNAPTQVGATVVVAAQQGVAPVGAFSFHIVAVVPVGGVVRAVFSNPNLANITFQATFYVWG